MNKLTSREAAAFLGERDDFVLLTHKRPDGDTIGSAALLCRGLRAMGKKAHLLKILRSPPNTPPMRRG